MSEIRYFRRGAATLSVFDAMDIANYISKPIMRDRLIIWESGKHDCDWLFKPQNFLPEGRRGDYSDMEVGPRRKIEDLKITKFEREWGAKVEARYLRENGLPRIGGGEL